MARPDPPRPEPGSARRRRPDPRDAVEPGAPPGSQRSSFFALLPAIVLPMFLAVVDQTIVATALPAIAGSLGGVERISWIVVAYLVASTIAAPVYGRLGDRFGRRRLMLAALAVTIGASILCALAPSVEALTLARVLQGLGGGGLMTLSQALVGERVGPRERARYQGYLAAVAVSSSAFGPVAGGFLTEHLGWRSIFLMNVPVALVATVLAARLPHSASGDGKPFRFDLAGVALFAAFAASTLMALQAIQRLAPESAPAALALGAAATASVLLLARRERRAPDPLLPPALLREPSIWRSDALAACHGAILVSLITFLPIYFRVVHDRAPAEIGLLLLPMPLGLGIGSMATGRLVSWTGRTTIYPAVGLAGVVLGVVALALVSGSVTAQQFSFALGGLAVFMGTVMGVVQVTVQSAAGPAQLGAAAASVQFSRAFGAAIGTAIVGVVLFATLAATDPQAADVFGALVEGGPDALAGLEPSRQAEVAQAIGSAFRAAFLAVAAFGVLAFGLALSIPLRRL